MDMQLVAPPSSQAQDLLIDVLYIIRFDDKSNIKLWGNISSEKSINKSNIE